MNGEMKTRTRRLSAAARCLLACCVAAADAGGQDVPPSARLEAAWQRFAADPSLFAASIGVHVVEAASGRVLFDRNGRAGLVPASSQKLLTAAAALDLLGPSFRFETRFLLPDPPASGRPAGPLVVQGGGDPTLGSARFPGTAPEAVAARVLDALRQAGVTSLSGGVAALTGEAPHGSVPDGWLWEDIGNYYGAAPASLNWRENRYELLLRPGRRAGEPVAILSADPPLQGVPLGNELVTGPPGSGDRAGLYFTPGAQGLVVRGSVPCCLAEFRISGAVADPDLSAARALGRLLGTQGPAFVWRRVPVGTPPLKPVLTYRSPPLDSILQPFLRQSVNLFGEALLRAVSVRGGGDGSHADGRERLLRFWVSKGIDVRMLSLHDGSGLSPLNRVSAEALARAVAYALQRPWFQAFDRAMPVHDGIRMKSGTMGGVRSYAGYLRVGDGRDYAFAVVVNHFSGPGAPVAERIRRFVAALR